MKIALAGASGGIGGGLLRRLIARDGVQSIDATFHQKQPSLMHPKVKWHGVDLTKERSVEIWADSLGELDWCINAAGLLHGEEGRPEKSIRECSADFFVDNIRINTLPTLLLAKHFQKKLSHERPAVFAVLSARVGSIGDNRLGGWYSYRGSKAALNMCVKSLSIEWRRSLPNVTVAALHPGTVDTALSKPFQRNVAEERLFSPDRAAAYLIDVLDSLTPEFSGRFWSYRGDEIPW